MRPLYLKVCTARTCVCCNKRVADWPSSRDNGTRKQNYFCIFKEGCLLSSLWDLACTTKELNNSGNKFKAVVILDSARAALWKAITHRAWTHRASRCGSDDQLLKIFANRRNFLDITWLCKEGTVAGVGIVLVQSSALLRLGVRNVRLHGDIK